MQHPDDTATVLQIMSDARDRNQTAQFGLLDRLLDHHLITDADAQPLRDRVLGAPSTPPATMRPITSRATPPALPPTAPPPAATPVPATPGPQAAAGGTAPAKKVYVVGDADVTGQAAAPDSQPGPDPAAPTGGVKKWKSVKKNPPQGSR